MLKFLRRCAPIAIAAAITMPVSGASSYEELEGKADRFFNHSEWLSALAMMQLMLEQKPEATGVRSRAIVAAGMAADTVAQMRLSSEGIRNLVPIDSLFSGVERSALAIGHPWVYTSWIERMVKAEPWMRRTADSYLLRFYTFRRDAPGMIEYARRMLTRMPSNPQYLCLLADGYMTAGKYTEATEAYSRALEADPADLHALLSLGNYYLLSGDREKALPYLRRAAAIRPTPYLEKILAE